MRGTRGGKTRNERRKAAKDKLQSEDTYFADTGCSPVKRSQNMAKNDLQRASDKNQSFKEKFDGMTAPQSSEVKGWIKKDL